MITIRYTAPDELDISGIADELQAVRREILAFARSDIPEMIVPADAAADPAPYDSSLSKLIIRKRPGAVNVSLGKEANVDVEGSPTCLEAFASFFNFTLDDKDGFHFHYEYFEGNEWIAPESIPLVIMVKSKKAE